MKGGFGRPSVATEIQKTFEAFALMGNPCPHAGMVPDLAVKIFCLAVYIFSAAIPRTALYLLKVKQEEDP